MSVPSVGPEPRIGGSRWRQRLMPLYVATCVADALSRLVPQGPAAAALQARLYAELRAESGQ